MVRRYKQRFTKREMAIVEMIRYHKKSGHSFLNSDDVLSVLGSKGLLPEKHIRRSFMVTMNGLCNKLNASGIFIKKSHTIGRGNKSFWYLNEEAWLSNLCRLFR